MVEDATAGGVDDDIRLVVDDENVAFAGHEGDARGGLRLHVRRRRQSAQQIALSGVNEDDAVCKRRGQVEETADGTESHLSIR